MNFTQLPNKRKKKHRGYYLDDHEYEQFKKICIKMGSRPGTEVRKMVYRFISDFMGLIEN